MAKDTRTRMLETTARLLQHRGFYGTALSDILEQSGAPRGSLYFHFPGGKEQLVLECRSGQLWLTMDFYDERGAHVAHVRLNQWAFNEGDRFALQTNSPALAPFGSSPWVTIANRETGEVYLEAVVTPEGRIELVQGRFFTHKGERVEVTPHVCRIGPTVSHFGEVFECRGGPAAIG